MPRPRKHRRIGQRPRYGTFGPVGHPEVENVILKLEEMESLRLMDLEHLDQQACAERMGISRTTFQRIYKMARQKVAESIIEGKRLLIEEECSCPQCQEQRNKFTRP